MNIFLWHGICSYINTNENHRGDINVKTCSGS